mmetsp:Transcript_5836/g.8300  ORF Transcript_5836/g.8300 Transcript_5836/m.8300 type:complete len:95 (-) Transcript_5836:29-313(-)
MTEVHERDTGVCEPLVAERVANSSWFKIDLLSEAGLLLCEFSPVHVMFRTERGQMNLVEVPRVSGYYVKLSLSSQEKKRKQQHLFSHNPFAATI